MYRSRQGPVGPHQAAVLGDLQAFKVQVRADKCRAVQTMRGDEATHAWQGCPLGKLHLRKISDKTYEVFNDPALGPTEGFRGYGSFTFFGSHPIWVQNIDLGRRDPVLDCVQESVLDCVQESTKSDCRRWRYVRMYVHGSLHACIER